MTKDFDKLAAMERALTSLCLTVEATGGIERNEHGLAIPLADRDWVDMGEAYLEACEALNREPLVINPTDLDERE